MVHYSLTRHIFNLHLGDVFGSFWHSFQTLILKKQNRFYFKSGYKNDKLKNISDNEEKSIQTKEVQIYQHLKYLSTTKLDYAANPTWITSASLYSFIHSIPSLSSTSRSMSSILMITHDGLSLIVKYLSEAVHREGWLKSHLGIWTSSIVFYQILLIFGFWWS